MKPQRIFQVVALIAFIVVVASRCHNRDEPINRRPVEPWAFRSVLDKKPRMLTLALDSSLYVAYDLHACSVYKAWKGGVSMEGAAYTDRKNVQPTSWGKAYMLDSLGSTQWIIERQGGSQPTRVSYDGHYFKNNHIHLKYSIISQSGDTIHVEERPEFVRHKSGEPAFERIFTLSDVPEGIAIRLVLPEGTLALSNKTSTRHIVSFAEPPKQFPPQPGISYDHRGRYWMEKSDCMTCHELDRRTVGPAFQEVALKYPREKTAVQYLVRKIQEGGSGVWGTTPMNPHPSLAEGEIREMVNYILSLKPRENVATATMRQVTREKIESKPRPGFGAPLEGVHPSYDVQTIHGSNFKPRVGGLAFLPDGRLLVTTWDKMGAVYMLDGVETGDTARISVKRIASGLAEPLGIEVVDGEIYVLQKHELTRLKDLDGDEVVDAYESLCSSWGVTADFHEFAFGLVHKDGHFYATLSMAMRLLSSERQKPDRGRTIRIDKDGSHHWINSGLRTPNGIGLGVDNEIFVTDNQGEWTPANKLIHVKQGEFLGMEWGLPEGSAEPPPVAAPAIWLPEDEIGNSPSEPVLIHSGPYKGQMLHGDVTHGGIKRDFIEKINGDYQGAVFRFTQGLEAGINRMRWGPDGALYVGGVGMVGGWSWKEKQYGLQKLVFNGKITFEMLAVRARPHGFEIEFTEPLEEDQKILASDFLVQQWRYERTSAYGGPKLDHASLRISCLTISADRKRIDLSIDGLKPGHVVYIAIPSDLQSASGQSLWSNETWYTLNNIPVE